MFLFKYNLQKFLFCFLASDVTR